jgi:hypothetical protein
VGPISVDQTIAGGVSVHRDTRGAQRDHIPVDGAHRHLQLGGQLPGRQPTAALEHQDYGQQAIGSHGGKSGPQH